MIFSFTEDQFLNPDLIKVVYGVAGRGKSSIINDFFQSRNIDYLWTTSTNKLKRDAVERYGCNASTVASALFTSENGRFYIEDKTPATYTIIIDEVLQTSPRVLEWARTHKGIYNIIMLTDTKQMLAKGEGLGARFLEIFENFLNEDFVIKDEGKETKRARDAETKEKIEYLYDKSNDGTFEFRKDLNSKRFKVIHYEDMQFNTNDIYITHLNVTEDFLYREKSFATMNFCEDDLIPKGTIAKNPPKDYTRHPILSQNQAEKMRANAYYQLKNVGSCTRYQGSECTTSQTLYYIITPRSQVTNREWYTVVSRCWSINSIVIVIAKDEVKKEIKTFNNKKVKNVKTLIALSEVESNEEN